MASPLRLGRRSHWKRYLALAFLALAFIAAATLGTFSALYLFESEDIPDVAQLDDHKPSIITRLHSADGEAIAEFAEERRIVIDFQDLPQNLLDAITAVEDANFYQHNGLNVRGILRAAIENAKAGRVVEGGSSLTQQLAKLMFLTPERSLKRKVREAILALNIEREYSKEEILAFYCNQVYFGHNRYGVEAAARYYFGKSVTDLELPEAALIAGLPQRPNAYSPYRNPDAATTRRNHVLDRMRDVGSITPEEASAASESPLGLVPFEVDDNSFAPYFVEEVRQVLETTYGQKRLYHEGLDVTTTLDAGLQTAAESALRDGLLAFDKRHGWRGPDENLLQTDQNVDLATWQHPAWRQPVAIDQIVPGLVTSVSDRMVTVRIGEFRGAIRDLPRWVRHRRASDIYRIGDVGLFRILSIDRPNGLVGISVEQEPEVEGAIVALEVSTGRILALVGGWDFSRSRFNRAVQAKRQTGSAFKPILYAAALANGFTLADSVLDEPIAITDLDTGEVYSPKNYSKNYYGLTTIRSALEKSRNPVSVQLLQRIGAYTVIDTAYRLGLTAKLEPYPSLALGAFEVPLIEMTAAYSTFADLGVLHEPYLIEKIRDRDGRVIKRRSPTSRRAISAPVSFLMNQVLSGVIQNGTGVRAKRLGRTVAGKTGTTDDFTDAWFIGYSPSVACGVWVGYDVKRTLGKGEVGAKAALPIWIDFMRVALNDKANEEFLAPPGVEFVLVDKSTGMRHSDICTNSFRETFVRGTAPVTYCSDTDHEVRELPYYLQKLYLAGEPLPPMSSEESPAPTTVDPAATQPGN